MERFAGKEGRDGKSAALYFSPLHSQIDFLSPLIASHDVELRADRLVQKPDHVIGRRAASRGAALGRVRGPRYVMDSFIGTVRAHIEQIVRPLEAPQPNKLRPIKLNFFSAH